MLRIEMLSAERGDALLVEYGKQARLDHRVLIDGGPVNSGIYEGIRDRLEQIPVGLDGRRHFDLLVISHVDTDHIEGAIRLLQDERLRCIFDDIWFNGWKHLEAIDARSQVRVLGGLQGEFLGALLRHQGRPWNQLVHGGPLVVGDAGDALPRVTIAGGMELTLLSPDVDALERLRTAWRRDVEAAGFVAGDDEHALAALGERWWARPPVLGDGPISSSHDGSAANGASIAFIATYGGRSVLFGADAHDDVLTTSLRRLRAERVRDGVADERIRLDAIKLAHHGSKHNTTSQLLDEIACDRYLVSTDGTRFKHPDSAALTTVLRNHHGDADPILAFNHHQPRLANLANRPGVTVEFGPAAITTLPTSA